MEREKALQALFVSNCANVAASFGNRVSCTSLLQKAWGDEKDFDSLDLASGHEL